jgi:hypothetical protein
MFEKVVAGHGVEDCAVMIEAATRLRVLAVAFGNASARPTTKGGRQLPVARDKRSLGQILNDGLACR